jgi:hypothetical protein
MENSTNLVQFVNQEGSEFVINTKTGEAFISNNAGARILETAPTTFRRVRDSLKIEGKEATYKAGASVQRSPLLSSIDFYTIALEIRPDIAQQMLLAGVNLFIYGHAGYKVSVVQQESKPEPITKVALAEAYLKQAKLEAATTDLPGLANINNALIESQDQPCLPGYFNVWETLSEKYDYPTTKLLNKPLSKRMGQAARLHGAKPKADTIRILVRLPNGELKSIKTNIYPISLLCVFEEILRQAITEFGIQTA